MYEVFKSGEKIFPVWRYSVYLITVGTNNPEIINLARVDNVFIHHDKCQICFYFTGRTDYVMIPFDNNADRDQAYNKLIKLVEGLRNTETDR